MNYKIKKIYWRNGNIRYIPLTKFLFVWVNILKNRRVTGSMFFPEKMWIDKINYVCRSENDARNAIDAYREYYKCLYGTDIINTEDVTV